MCSCMYGLIRSGHLGCAPASRDVEGDGVTAHVGYDDAPLVTHRKFQIGQCQTVPRAETGTPMPVVQHCVELLVIPERVGKTNKY